MSESPSPQKRVQSPPSVLSSSSSSSSSSSLSSSLSSSGPSGSHDHFLSGHCRPLISTSFHQDPAAPNLSSPAPSYQHGLSFVVKAPHGINSAVPSTDPHLPASSKPALSSSANCVAPMLPNHIHSVLDHQNNSSYALTQSTLILLELPSATSFYGLLQSSVPHEAGSTYANQNNSSLPKSTVWHVYFNSEDQLTNVNFLMKYLVTF